MSTMQRNHIDHVTLYPVVFLILMSLGIVYSASAYISYLKGDSEAMLMNHAVRVFIAIVALFVATKIDYHIYLKFSKPVLLLGIVLLITTLIFGEHQKGAGRWLPFLGKSFQPSEFVRVALLFHLAALIATKGEHLSDLKRGFIPLMTWVVIVAGLVIAQPSFSVAATIVLVSLIVMYLGRVRLKHLLMTGLLAMLVLGVIMVMAPYRMQRLLSYFSGEGMHWQLKQALIAFGNGGIFGVGIGESIQRDLFLPEPYGDFVYPIIGEEYGFLGATFLLLIYFWIMYRGFRIARYAEDEFGRMLAIAITCATVVSALINAGVTTGLLPTTGLTMPFISFGGSSLLGSAFAIGVLLNISSQTGMHPRVRQVPVVGTVSADTADVGKVY